MKAQQARLTGRWAAAARALDKVASESWALPEVDPMRIRWTVATAECALMLGGTVRARTLAGEALRLVESEGLGDLLPSALRVMGTVTWRTGDLRGGRVLLDRALQRALTARDVDSVVRCNVELSHICLDRGLLDEAEAHLRQAARSAGTDPHLRLLPLPALANVQQRRADREGAQRLFEQALEQAREVGDLLCEAMAQHGLANLALEAGNSDGAVERVREAHGAYTRCGYTFGEAVCYNLLGEAHRMKGEDARAVRAYEQSVAAGDRVGHPGLLPRANLAVLRIEQGRLQEARGLIEQVLTAAESRGLRPLVVSMHALLLPCVAHDELLLQHHLLRASDGLEETGLYDRDLAWTAQLAADLCTFPHLEVRCRALALHQFQQLGEAMAVRVELTALNNLAITGAPIPAGPFDLVSPVGEGSMGQVWRARHRLGFDAAVKVVSTTQQRDRLVQLLEEEARAVVGLDHRNVIRLIDFGTLGPEAEAMRPGMHAGAPWLAMELVRGGSLEDCIGQLPWDRCRELILDLLSALGHAHSRGVLHLDVKPANVLLTDDEQPVTKLVDFGLAAVLSMAAGKVRIAGTPLYMAPEQFLGNSRDWGPWTDLYALGCVAVHLVTGKAPFQRGDLAAIREAHLNEEPQIELPAGVPPAFADWAQSLLVKDLRKRTRFAADAADALRWADENHYTLPMPKITEQQSAPDRARSGLALFELRRPPLIGRAAERGALFDVLKRVLKTYKPEVVVLSGDAGVGKTALARWLAERAHAEGRASTLWAKGGDSDPVSSLVAGRLGLTGLTAEEAVERIAEREPGLAAHQIQALAAIGTGDRPEGFRIDQVLDALVRLIELDCEERPVVLHVEGSTTRYPALVRLGEQLLACELPVLVLFELRPEDVPARGRGQAVVDGAVEVAVERLPDGAIRELLDAMLPLSAELGVALTDRAGGNPRLALELLGSLIRADSLSIGSSGVSLRTGMRVDLPAGLSARWRDRLDSVLSGLGEEAWTALAVGALLGGQVQMTDWRAGCEAAGIRSLSSVLRRLRQARLAVPTPDRGFAFAPAVLRDVVLEVAHERGLYEGACLAAVAAPILQVDPGRRGELLADAGASAEAEPLLQQGARDALLRGDVLKSREYGRRSADALRAMGVGPNDERWARWHMLHCRIAAEQGQVQEGEFHAERLLTLAKRGDLPGLVADGLRWMATVDVIARRAESAQVGFQEALAAYVALGDKRGQADAHHGIAIVGRIHARYADALEHLVIATDLLRGAGADELLASVLSTMGDVYRRKGEEALSKAAFEEALQLTKALSAWGSMSTALLGLGELARKRGELDEAEGHYREALRLRSSGQLLKAASAHLNLALVLMARGRFDEAERALNELINRLDAKRDSAVVMWARVALLPVVAVRAERDWCAVYNPLSGPLSGRGLRDPDVAWLLELAGDRAHGAGQPARAQQCWSLAAEHWRHVGQEERALACEGRPL